MSPLGCAQIQCNLCPYKKRRLGQTRDGCVRKDIEEHHKKVAICKERGLKEIKLADILTLDFQNYEKINFCCLSHPIHGSLLWQG